MTEGIKIYKTQDLVLRVKQSYDPAKLNLKKWVSFLDVLCGDREFQKEAIRDAIIFFASGEYRSIEDLVDENFRKINTEISVLPPPLLLASTKKVRANSQARTALGQSAETVHGRGNAVRRAGQ